MFLNGLTVFPPPPGATPHRISTSTRRYDDDLPARHQQALQRVHVHVLHRPPRPRRHRHRGARGVTQHHTHVGSMRSDVNTTWLADTGTAASTLVSWRRAGSSASYGTAYGR
jgi:hypothetical protein